MSQYNTISGNISTHALTEGDMISFVTLFVLGYFNSRPHGGRLCWEVVKYDKKMISTHALTEGDQVVERIIEVVWKFQLTPSRRATKKL